MNGRVRVIRVAYLMSDSRVITDNIFLAHYYHVNYHVKFKQNVISDMFFSFGWGVVWNVLSTRVNLMAIYNGDSVQFHVDQFDVHSNVQSA